jgi:hypothetical protein
MLPCSGLMIWLRLVCELVSSLAPSALSLDDTSVFLSFLLFHSKQNGTCAAGRVMLKDLASECAPPSFSYCRGPMIGQSKSRLMLSSDNLCSELFCSALQMYDGWSVA